MAQVNSWAWYPGTTWPGYSASSASTIGAAQNGLSVAPGSYQDIRWNDSNGDGVIDDADRDDATTQGESVTVGGRSLTVREIGNYSGSQIMVKGAPVSVDLSVWVLSDGTYMVRLPDSQIPAGVHHNAVEGISLGRWNGVEYSGSYTASRDAPFICFAAGTLILTRKGLVAVECLRQDDLVLTADNGFQPLRWRGRRRVAGIGRNAPVRIAAGALGNDRDLVVSPLHRLVLTGWRAELYGGAPELLVPARGLLHHRGIRQAPVPDVTYVHLLFDRHEIVFAEGIASESFHPGVVGMARLDPAVRDEIHALFPGLRDGIFGSTARPCATGKAARVLA